MIRSRLLSLKHIAYALLTMALVLIFSEVGLRYYDSYTAQITRNGSYDAGLVCKSWTMHHCLKPLQSVELAHPDTGSLVRIETNSLGLRSAEVAVPKPRGVYRVVCLGDERTLGLEVPLDETFSLQLQTILQKRTRLRVEVLNAGVPGYCPALSYLQLKHRLIALQPDLVILNFDMSDIADDYACRRHISTAQSGVPQSCAHPDLKPPVGRGTFESDQLLLLPQWAKQTAADVLTGNMRSAASQSINSPQGRYAWLNIQPPDWSIYIQQALQPISSLQTLAHGYSAQFLVACSPVPWQVSPTASCGTGIREAVGVSMGTICQSRQPFDILAEYCRDTGIAFCDSCGAFRQSADPDRLFCTNSIAFSREGHATYARRLAQSILEHAARNRTGNRSVFR